MIFTGQFPDVFLRGRIIVRFALPGGLNISVAEAHVCYPLRRQLPDDIFFHELQVLEPSRGVYSYYEDALFYVRRHRMQRQGFAEDVVPAAPQVLKFNTLGYPKVPVH
jgi:hypothetical protein